MILGGFVMKFNIIPCGGLYKVQVFDENENCYINIGKACGYYTADVAREFCRRYERSH